MQDNKAKRYVRREDLLEEVGMNCDDALLTLLTAKVPSPLQFIAVERCHHKSSFGISIPHPRLGAQS
jgi:hypothetical protein